MSGTPYSRREVIAYAHRPRPAREESRRRAPRARRPASTHPPAIMALHWATLAAVVLGVAAIILREWVDERAWRLLLLDMHRSLELAVWLMTLLRIAAHFYLHDRRVSHDLPRPLLVIGGASHMALYLMMLALPLLGWAQSSARGQLVHFFGIALPALTGRDRDLADALGAWHQWGAWLFLGLIVAHAGAALWHHYGRRDAVLRSMLPIAARHRAPARHGALAPLS